MGMAGSVRTFDSILLTGIARLLLALREKTLWVINSLWMNLG